MGRADNRQTTKQPNEEGTMKAMKPTPYEARERLLIVTAKVVQNWLHADFNGDEAAHKDERARLRSDLDAALSHVVVAEPGPDRVAVTYTPAVHNNCASDCAAIIVQGFGDGDCDCGAQRENAEREAKGNAVLAAITSSLPDRNPRGVERFLLTLHQQGFEVVRREQAAAAEDFVKVRAALRAIDDALPNSVDVTKPTLERVERAMLEHGKLRSAVHWALGEHSDEFKEEPPAEPGRFAGKFWWRRELRARAFG